MTLQPTQHQATAADGQAATYFIPPAQLSAASQLLKDRGLTAPRGSLLLFANILAMWTRDPSRPIQCKGIAEAAEVSRNTVRKLVDLIAVCHDAEVVECRNKYGMHDGLLVSATHTPSNGEPMAKLSASYPEAIPTQSPGVLARALEIPTRALLEHHRAPLERHRAPLERHRALLRAPLEISKSSIELERDLDLSPPASAHAHAVVLTSRAGDQKVITQAIQTALAFQASLGIAYPSQQDIDKAVNGLLSRVADEAITYPVVVDRLANALSWLASQHWLHGRPYPNNLCASLAAHLQGKYPHPPSDTGSRPDCHAETLCSASYGPEGFSLVDTTGLPVELPSCPVEQPVPFETHESRPVLMRELVEVHA